MELKSKSLKNSIYKINANNKNLLRFKSFPPNNKFAPSFDFPFWESRISISLNRKLLKEIKKKKYFYQEDTPTNEFWKTYNIFTWSLKNIKQLQKEIKKNLIDYLKVLNITIPEPIYINGWLCPQKQKQALKLHNHAIHPNAFLTGQVVLSPSNLPLGIMLPYLYSEYGFLWLPSGEASIKIFPSSIPHFVPELQEKERYAIAFDLITEAGYRTFKHSTDDPQDPIYRAIIL